MPVVISGTNGVTFPDSSLQAAAASPYVLKNRIINGAMVIDQRNAGASVTPNDTYVLDRWFSNTGGVASKFSVQQNAGSVTPPEKFTKYLGVTSLSAYTVGSSEFFLQTQYIEGFNIADLAWGTASAVTVTLSFWVRSSLTGTFGGALNNNGNSRSYPYSYTISSANTWEYKTITITGDTTGTWATDTNRGIAVRFGLGVGSTNSGTAGSWSSSAYYSATGATSVVGTNGATFYITGVQLEVGSTATPFERRLYNQELANCQRYYEINLDSGTAPAANIPFANSSGHNFTAYGATTCRSGNIPFAVVKRTAPVMTFYRTSLSASNNSSWQWFNGSAWVNTATATVITVATCQSFQAEITSSSMSANSSYIGAGNWAASSEL